MVFGCCCDLLFTSQPEEPLNIDAVKKTQQEFAQNLDSNSGGSTPFLSFPSLPFPSLPFLRAEFWNLTNDCGGDDGGGVRACLLCFASLRFALPCFAFLSFAVVVVARLAAAASARSGCGRRCGGEGWRGTTNMDDVSSLSHK